MSGPDLESGGGGGSSLGDSVAGVDASLFVDGGEIKMAKLVSTLLGATWITVVAGWIAIVETITVVHVRVLNAIARLYVRVIEAFGVGGAEALEASWGAAFRAAVAADPLLAPMILTLEIIGVSALLLYLKRRWT